MSTALALSPHLDDAAFSCGGLLAQLADAGWRTVLVTAFTATILPATGFALACQLDKGLGPDIDYMALRRAEDERAAAILGAADLRWLDLPEAPHRGYRSAPALFAEISEDDTVWRPLADAVASLLAELQPAVILAPQGLGGHVDHRHMIRAVQQATDPDRVAWYRDTPYAIRNPAARPFVAALDEAIVPIEAGLDRKVAASCAYASQIGFQFGGAEGAALALRKFARQEGSGRPAERFMGRLRLNEVRP